MLLEKGTKTYLRLFICWALFIGLFSSLWPKLEAFDEKVLEASIEQHYKSRPTQDTPMQLMALEEDGWAHGSSRFEVDMLYIIGDNQAELGTLTPKAACSGVCENFVFKSSSWNTDEDKLREQAYGLAETYKEDDVYIFHWFFICHAIWIDVLYRTRVLGDFHRFCRNENASVFRSVSIIRRMYLCVPVRNCKTEGTIPKLCLIKNCISSSLSEKELNSQAVVFVKRDMFFRWDNQCLNFLAWLIAQCLDP